jgi:hypothetical protein
MSPLADDIGERLHLQVGALVRLVGVDVADLIPASRVRPAAEQLAAALCSPDHREAAQAAIDSAPLVDLDDPNDAASPLGIAIASTTGYDEVGATDAARLLRVSRARVYALLDAGRLDRGPTGGITRASIARRLAQRQPTCARERRSTPCMAATHSVLST